jgi:hypothetical protein
MRRSTAGACLPVTVGSVPLRAAALASRVHDASGRRSKAQACRRMQHCTHGRLILETDPSTIASRVAMRGADADVPLAEQVRSCIAGRARCVHADLLASVACPDAHFLRSCHHFHMGSQQAQCPCGLGSLAASGPRQADSIAGLWHMLQSVQQ